MLVFEVFLLQSNRRLMEMLVVSRYENDGKLPGLSLKSAALSLAGCKTAPMLENLGMWIHVLLPFGEGPLVGL
jgi:hypothetical protein